MDQTEKGQLLENQKKKSGPTPVKKNRRLPRTQKLIERPTNLFLELDRAPKKTLECKKKRTKSKGPKKGKTGKSKIVRNETH